jgi:hypothetical protein
MFEADSPTWIAVVIASVYLLQNATKDLPMGRWLSVFSLGWIIAGLMSILPFALKGSWMAMGAGYLLMGVLIVNTLVLSAASKTPEQFISYKSKGLETVGLMFFSFVSAGLVVLVKDCFMGLKRLLNTKCQNPDRMLFFWSNV